jgi:hypothetical protein
MIGRTTRFLFVLSIAALAAGSAQALDVIIDFETEDDLVTPLIHGQSIYSTARPNHTNPFVPFSNDTHLEFGRFVTVSSTNLGSDGNLGPAIFDSDPADTTSTSDPDLLVGLGNILMLQRDEGPATHLDPTNGLIFNNPSDEGTGDDNGSIVFESLQAGVLVHPISIDLVDVDDNVELDIVLTDHAGLMRTYTAPPNWTTDITEAPVGWHTLSLETLSDQPAAAGATGGPATVVEDAGFDSANVVRVEVRYFGATPSGGIDNLRFSVDIIPEPSGLLLSGVAAIGCLLARQRRQPTG